MFCTISEKIDKYDEMSFLFRNDSVLITVHDCDGNLFNVHGCNYQFPFG